MTDDTTERMQGRVAFKQGEPIEANPHSPGEPDKLAWDEGWKAAQAEAEEREAVTGDDDILRGKLL